MIPVDFSTELRLPFERASVETDRDARREDRMAHPQVMSHPQARTKRMTWVIFVAGAVLAWGAYGALLYEGQVRLANPLKALLCVGVAYFLIGIIVPVFALGAQG